MHLFRNIMLDVLHCMINNHSFLIYCQNRPSDYIYRKAEHKNRSTGNAWRKGPLRPGN